MKFYSLSIKSSKNAEKIPVFYCLNISNSLASTWKITNMHLVLKDCMVSKSKLMSISVNDTLSVQIQNSSFANLHVAGKHRIDMKNINLSFNNEENHPFLVAANSVINISNCMFSGNARPTPALVKISSSEISIEHTTVVQFQTHDSVVDIQNSELIMKNVMFSFNNGILNHYNNSGVFLSNCSFLDNVGYAVFRVETTFLSLSRCNFTDNNRAISSTGKSRVTAYSCNFTHTTGANAIEVTTTSLSLIKCTFFRNNGAITGVRNSRIKATMCTFSHNNKSVVIEVEKTLIHLISCTYEQNNGVIFGYTASRISAQNCTFTQTSKSTVINLLSARIDLTRCTFAGNKGVIYDYSNSSISALNCGFNNNKGDSVIHMEATHVNLAGCTFSNSNVVIFGNSNNSIFARGCNFTDNTGSAVIDVALTRVQLTECVFSLNTGVIYSTNNSKVLAHNSIFSRNNKTVVIDVKDSQFSLTGCVFGWNSGGIFGFDNSRILANNCSFTQNNKSAVIQARRSEVVLTSCFYANNRGGLSGQSNSTISAEKCNFTENLIIGIFDVDNSNLSLNECTFSLNNQIISGYRQSSISAQNCEFAHNTNATLVDVKGAYIRIGGCTFSWNTDVISLSSNSTLLSHNCSFSHNSGVLEVKSSPVVLTSCNFSSNNRVIAGFWKSSIFANNCLFKENNQSAIIEVRTSQITLTSCSYENNSGEILGTSNSQISAQNCTFTNNSQTALIDAETTHVNLFGCTFSLNIKCLYVGKDSSLDVSNSTLLDNGPRSVVQCDDCDCINFHNSIFSENNVGGFGALFWVETATATLSQHATHIKLTNCRFENNRHILLSLYGAHIMTCTRCAFIFSLLPTEDVGNTIVQMESGSQLAVVDSTFQISPDAFYVAHITSSNITTSNTNIYGFLLVKLYSESWLNFYNSSIIGLHNANKMVPFSMKMMFSAKSSTIMLRQSVIHWAGQGFVLSNPGSVVIADCTIVIQSSSSVFFSVTNGSFSLSNTQVNVDVVYPHFNNRLKEDYCQPPPQNVLFGLPSLVHLYDSELLFANVTTNQLSADTMAHQFEIWCKFQGSNITMDRSNFSSMAFYLYGTATNHLIATNTRLLGCGSFFICDNPDYILLENSKVNMYNYLHCELSTNCKRSLQTLRVAGTTLILQNPLETVTTLLTWNSIIQTGDNSHNTSEYNFLTEASSSGMLNCSKCDNFSETVYTAGNETTQLVRETTYFHKSFSHGSVKQPVLHFSITTQEMWKLYMPV